jgi:hypothetical protein
MSYQKKLEAFRVQFQSHHNERKARLYPQSQPDSVEVEEGYKFDKVFLVSDGEPVGRYMVESRTGDIYGIKSWTQVNRRRWYGTLNTVDQYDWSEERGRPLPGTEAEKKHVAREDRITRKHKKRGRKPKALALSGVN